MTCGINDNMGAAKVTISLNPDLVQLLDQLVRAHVFASRSQAIQTALQEKLMRLQKTRLAHECAKLDPAEEQALAEFGLR